MIGCGVCLVVVGVVVLFEEVDFVQFVVMVFVDYGYWYYVGFG